MSYGHASYQRFYILTNAVGLVYDSGGISNDEISFLVFFSRNPSFPSGLKNFSDQIILP